MAELLTGIHRHPFYSWVCTFSPIAWKKIKIILKLLILISNIFWQSVTLSKHNHLYIVSNIETVFSWHLADTNKEFGDIFPWHPTILAAQYTNFVPVSKKRKAIMTAFLYSASPTLVGLFTPLPSKSWNVYNYKPGTSKKNSR